MKRTIVTILLAALAGGCMTMPERPDSPSAPEETGPIAQPQPETPEPPPDTCRELLTSLEETRPLLGSLDERLADQATRIETAVAKLQRPPPAPPAPKCPDVRQTQVDDKVVVGAIEWVYMHPPGRHYRARVDSGAETSSLSAAEIVEFERDGDDWVRFVFQHDTEADPVEIERPIERTVRIRQVSSDEPERRVVVELDIRLGERMHATEFTLTDRRAMTYPVLLGREFLMDLYLVDVAREYTHRRRDRR